LDSAAEAGYVESDVVDLTEVAVADLRDIPSPDRSRRLLDQVLRARSNAMGGGNPTGRAE
jgi:hypothetical protein